MEGIEAVSSLASIASEVYKKFCQVPANREEVASLQLRLNLLTNCLNNTASWDGRGQGIIGEIRATLTRAERLADDFAAKANDRIHQFVWSNKYADRCSSINRELSGFIQLLGVASDQQQLDCLNEIQSKMESRRQHDLDVGEQLKLLRQAVLEVQRLHYDQKQTTASLQKIRDTLAESASTAANSVASEGEGEGALTPSMTADLSGLPSHVRELFLREKYQTCLLDSRLLEFEESADSPSGTFGVVHRGTYLGKPIAAKLLINQDPTAQAIKEVLDETLLLKQYNFDYFATVYGICIVESGGGGSSSSIKKSPAIVMKCMDSDLFRFLHRSDRQDLKLSLRWKLKSAITIAKAVEALHKLNILHRDLKTLNILVSGRDADNICITDFGMARMRKEAATLRNSATFEPGQHETIGSYPWMAPEIMRASKYTDRADVFSLGVIIWEVFTWEEPWGEAVSVRAIENAVCSGARLDTDDVPAEISSLLGKMWRANPRDRPSAKEVAAELIAFQKRHGPSHKPSPTIPLSLPDKDDLKDEETGHGVSGPSNPDDLNDTPPDRSELNMCGYRMTKRKGGILAAVAFVLAVAIAVVGSMVAGGGNPAGAPPTLAPSSSPAVGTMVAGGGSGNANSGGIPGSSGGSLVGALLTRAPATSPEVVGAMIAGGDSGNGNSGGIPGSFGGSLVGAFSTRAPATSPEVGTMIAGGGSGDGNSGGAPGSIGGLPVEATALRLVTSEDIAGGHSSTENVAVRGDIAVVGAPYNEKGAIFVLNRDETGWSEVAKLKAPDGEGGDQFGYSVAIDGDTIVVGAYGDDSYKGSVHVFVKIDDSWQHQARLVAPDRAVYGYFGYSVGIHQNRVVVGTYGYDSNGDGAGSAYVFAQNDATWALEAKLLAPDGDAEDWFGRSVGIFDHTIVVGAPYEDAGATESGAAHVYSRTLGGVWEHRAKLSNPDGAFLDYFGQSVGIHGNRVIVGAPLDDSNGRNAGASFIFADEGPEWGLEAKLLAPDGTSKDYFGRSVDIFEGTAVVGSPYDDDNGLDSGSVHLFELTRGAWLHRTKLLAPDGIAGDWFGRGVAVHNGTVIAHSEGSGETFAFSR